MMQRVKMIGRKKHIHVLVIGNLVIGQLSLVIGHLEKEHIQILRFQNYPVKTVSNLNLIKAKIDLSQVFKP